MITAISRFKVANGMEQSVQEAFRNRPRLVESAPGFLGLETFTLRSDETVFYLVTRWTDAPSFHTWHKSPGHHKSHKLIPKGLKLDPTFTQLVVLDRIATSALEESVVDAAPFLARCLATSKSMHYLAASQDGTILVSNEAFLSAFQSPAADVIGSRLWDRIPSADADRILARITATNRDGKTFLCNFSDSHGHPFTLLCTLDVHSDGIVLVGELPLRQDQALTQQLLEMNNQLAVLARENVRQQKQLQKALDELHTTHWHLKKIQEVLPICMQCGKVKTGDGQWDALIDYLKVNSNFLSHGYCPDCYAQVETDWGL